MTIDFDLLRAKVFGGRLRQAQVDGINNILNEWTARELRDVRWLANILAQTTWETARTMQPVRERGGAAYLKSKPYYPYYGRGLIQITWKRNYQLFSIEDNPDAALLWPKALDILFDGMIKGLFTGRALTDYFNADTDDALHARRIVNGMDRAVEIRAIHNHYLQALREPHGPGLVFDGVAGQDAAG